MLNGTIKDDKANYHVAETELAEDVQLLDDTIALYIEPLQEAYRRIDEWKGKASLQASIADEIGVTVNAVEKRQSSDRNISKRSPILLNLLTKRKRIPRTLC